MRIAPTKRVLLRLLQQSRILAGVKQADMAAMLSLTQTDISKIERGVRNIGVVELRQWSIAVGVPFEEFARELDEQWSHLEALQRHLTARRA